MDIKSLRADLYNPNVRAFLIVIRTGEGTADFDGYKRLFGGELVNDLTDHPRRKVTKVLGGKEITSTAFGAYQFLASTWDDCVKALGLVDISPTSQDLAAAYLIVRRGAMDDVVAGRLDAAVIKCAKEWASLPGSPYGQPMITLDQVHATFERNGGKVAIQITPPREAEWPFPRNPPSPPPHPPVVPPTPTLPGTTMLPFIAAAIPSLIEAAPALIRIFGHGERSEENAKAAEVVAGIAKEVTGQTTVEGAVQIIQADPAKGAEFREAVHQNMGELLGWMLQAQEADEKSRDSALDRNLQLGKATNGRWLWLLGGLAVVIVLCSYAITSWVMFSPHTTFSDETKALLLGQIVIFGFVTVLGFLYGSNIQNRIDQQGRRQS